VESDPLTFGLCRRVTEAVVTHSAHSMGKDMAQIGFDERLSIHGRRAGATALSAVLPAEPHVGLTHRNNPGVTDCGAAYIGSEILDGALAIAKWL
jgi:hypothetical protein